MELVRVTGTRAELIGVREVPGVHVVASSAHDRRDGTWSVSAYGREGVTDVLRERGLEAVTLKPAERVRSEWALAAETGYLDSAALYARLRALADEHGDVCSVAALPQRTHEGREVLSLRIGSGPAVVVLGGVHAREWAPPDALLSLAEGLVRAYAAGGAFEHERWHDGTIPYAAWSVPADEVKRIVEGVTLVVVPLVNPDGRDFSLAGTDELHFMWRKNRRAGDGGPWCDGVDLNRNFDIAWDFERYYDAAAAREVQSSKDPCDEQIYIGPGAASEPETQNVQALVATERPVCFMDVHSYSRDILYPWGMDDDQAADPTQSFANPDWDRGGSHGGRDGVGGAYGEYLPSALGARHMAVARLMRDAMRDQAGGDPTARHRSVYTIKQALGLYPTTGTSDDYCSALTMLDQEAPPIVAFCLECGIDQAPDDPDDDEGGFHPDRVRKFPKIEREVHAAVLALARAAIGG
jgi:murein tripeptide amidase MpaA